MTDLKLPPHSDACEQAVIGALLTDSRVMDDLNLTPEDFYRQEYRTMFVAAKRLHESGKPVDLLTLSTALDDAEQLDDLGGLDALAEIMQAFPSTANVRHYASQIRDKAKLRELIRVGNEICDAAFNAVDPVIDVVNNAQALVMGIDAEQVRVSMQSADEISRDVIADIDFRFNNPDAMIGLSTGIPALDEMTCGLIPGNLYIVAGRPGMGKSTFAMGLVEHAALADVPCLVCSLEMPRKSLILRSYASIGSVPFGRLKTGQLLEQDWDKVTIAANRLKGKPLWIDDTPSLSTAQLRARARGMQRRLGRPLGLIMVDYLQLMGDQSKENETKRLEYISRTLKEIAKEFDCPVVALSQLNRDVERRNDKRPGMADLRGSGSIEQDADLIAFLYRDEVYDEGSRYKGLAELIIGKQRDGELGMIPLSAELHYMRFRQLDGPMPEAEPEPSTVHYLDRFTS